MSNEETLCTGETTASIYGITKRKRPMPDMFCKDQFVTVQFKYWNEKGSRKSKDNLNKYGLIVFKTTTPQPFYGPFSRTTQVSRCQKKASSGLYGAREDNKRQTHRQSGWAPLHPD